MKPYISIRYLAILMFALTGCANLTSPARQHTIDPNKAYWFDYDASRRGTLVFPTNKNIKTCAEPSPDVAFNLISKLEASLKPEAGGEATAKTEFNATVVELAKRTQMVMFLREAMFRLCEQSLNHSFEEKSIIETYTKILEAAINMVKTDRDEALAKAAEAQAKAAEAELKSLQFQQTMKPK
jgi:hypothetical protein